MKAAHARELSRGDGWPDLSLVRGQEAAKRALEVAAAGGHSILFIGPPGAGKTLLGRCLPGLLPPLAPVEAEEVARIYRSAGLEAPAARPIRIPRSEIRETQMTGNAARGRPGEASLAHRGVLFLDELTAFGRGTLEAVRRCLDDGEIRLDCATLLPSQFQLLAAMSPCPCGLSGGEGEPCRCPAGAVGRHRAQVPGTLLDRIHLHVEVPAVSWSELRAIAGEASSNVAERVAAARALQTERLGDGGTNAIMGPAEIRRHCALDAAGRALFELAWEYFKLSARAIDTAQQVARTIADLAGGGPIRPVALAEAVQYSSRRVLWGQGEKSPAGEHLPVRAQSSSARSPRRGAQAEIA
jgi:magnesium chelatase family protein